MPGVTLISGLFDIGREGLKKSYKRPFSYYLDNFRRLLAVAYPMVIYGDEDLRGIIEARTHAPTLFISTDPDTLRNTDIYPAIVAARDNVRRKATTSRILDSPQATLDLYMPLVSQKIYWLRDVARLNPFGSDHFMWVDGGIAGHFKRFSTRYFEGNFRSSLPAYMQNRMFFVLFPIRRDAEELHGFEKGKFDEWAGEPLDHAVRAAVFGGDAASIERTVPLYDEILRATLAEGLMGTEENIMTIMVCRHRQLFELHRTVSGIPSEFILRHDPLGSLLFKLGWQRIALKRASKRYRRRLLERLHLRERSAPLQVDSLSSK
ncbi:WlaTC/HtrL family glycosyltransferase [Rhodomicrobium lacus]|uniref:WlaTC/HtrL family glycosyltransferase n=1 Tax=Rhodomicrobium lacus TaxID=2498452 RepID=UPI0026E11F1F|nr:WlaTC/HtrL family glycosyltransferase [Rhodomicrobium lacus]WKW51019.1 WlaTC/HtrL family glycosyltransferase [Rhodomicrobium lacus]